MGDISIIRYSHVPFLCPSKSEHKRLLLMHGFYPTPFDWGTLHEREYVRSEVDEWTDVGIDGWEDESDLQRNFQMLSFLVSILIIEW